MDAMRQDETSVSGTAVVSQQRRVHIEPAMLLVMIGVGLTAPITIQYINHRVQLQYNMTSETSQTNCLNASSDDTNDVELEVEQKVASWSLAYSASGAFPMLFSTTIFATMSDTIGRKIPLLLSSFGIIAQYLSFICVAYFQLPLNYLVIGNFVWNCFGGYELFFSVSLALVADTAYKRQRTMKFIIIQTLVLCGSGLAQVGVGYWVVVSGYIPPFCLAALLDTLVLPYIILVLRETVTVKQPLCSGLKKFFTSVKTLFTLRENKRRYTLILLFLCHFLVFLSIITYFVPLVFLKVLAKPFCWNSVLLGYFSAAQPIFTGIGLLIGGYLLKMCLGDYGMILVGLLSGILMTFGIGFASKTVALFVFSGIGSLRGLPLAVLMSRLSKTVGDKQQGTLFAFVGALESLGLFIGPIVLGGIYRMTVDVYQPAVFNTLTGILLITAVFVCILKFMDLNDKSSYQRVDGTDIDANNEENSRSINTNESAPEI